LTFVNIIPKVSLEFLSKVVIGDSKIVVRYKFMTSLWYSPLYVIIIELPLSALDIIASLFVSISLIWRVVFFSLFSCVVLYVRSCSCSLYRRFML
jgi:hypothetical protein